MENSWKLSKPFDDLAGAVARHLRMLPIPDWFEFKHHVVTPTYEVYQVECKYIGVDMGIGSAEIGLRKWKAGTEFYTTEPRYELIPELDKLDEEQRRREIENYDILIANVRGRREAYRKVIEELIERLRGDDLWAEADKTSQPAVSGAAPDREKESGKGKPFLPNVSALKKYFPKGSMITARRILKTIPQAYADCEENGGRWGPGEISKLVHVGSVTVGRYLRAFRKMGIKDVEGTPLPE